MVSQCYKNIPVSTHYLAVTDAAATALGSPSQLSSTTTTEKPSSHVVGMYNNYVQNVPSMDLA